MARGADEFPILGPLRLKTISIEADGNCLFSSLDDQMHGKVDRARAHRIRLNCVEHMRNNSDAFKPFLEVRPGGGVRRNPKRKNNGASNIDHTIPTEGQVDATFRNHLAQMARRGTFADNLEIIAFTKVYKMDVRIYRANDVQTIKYDHDEADGVRPMALIALHTYEHYSSIRNLDGSLPNSQNISPRDVTPSSLPSTPLSPSLGSPGSHSTSGSSSISRDVDSEDQKEYYGPNKRQDRRKSRTTKKKEGLDTEDSEIPILSLIDGGNGTSISELTINTKKNTPLPSTTPMTALFPPAQLPFHSAQLPARTALPSPTKLGGWSQTQPEPTPLAGSLPGECKNKKAPSSAGSISPSSQSTQPRRRLITGHEKRSSTSSSPERPVIGPPLSPLQVATLKQLVTAREKKEQQKRAQKLARKERARRAAREGSILTHAI